MNDGIPLEGYHEKKAPVGPIDFPKDIHQAMIDIHAAELAENETSMFPSSKVDATHKLNRNLDSFCIDKIKLENPNLDFRQKATLRGFIDFLPENRPAVLAEFSDAMREKQRGERLEILEKFLKDRGARYLKCSFKNYECKNELQTNIVANLKTYAANFRFHLGNGSGLILFGPRGTGKDHLIIATAARILKDFAVQFQWINGVDLFARIRDSFDSKRDNETSILAPLVAAQVLVVSDPLPLVGPLTDFQKGVLFRLIDERYSSGKPSWITCNVTSGEELDERAGPQNADRLRDGAFAFFCNWGSYRRSLSIDSLAPKPAIIAQEATP